MVRYLLAPLLVLISATAAHAVVVPVMANTCVDVPSNRTVNVLTNQAIAARQTLVVSVASDQDIFDGSSVQLGSQALAIPVGGFKSKSQDGASIALHSHFLNAAASAGSTIQIKFKFATSTARVCIAALALPATSAPYLAVSQIAAETNSTTATSINADNNAVNAVAIVSHWFANDPGSVSSASPVVQSFCSVVTTPCFTVSADENVTGLATSALTWVNTTRTASAMVVLENPVLFANGFE